MATKTLNIAIDEQLLKEIDRAVKQDLGSRSEYFRRLALADLNRRSRWNELLSTGKEVGKQMDITSENQVYKIIKE
jgi:metal-responsive CopG/Arc/MetJ family transcriptional regulator